MRPIGCSRTGTNHYSALHRCRFVRGLPLDCRVHQADRWLSAQQLHEQGSGRQTQDGADLGLEPGLGQCRLPATAGTPTAGTIRNSAESDHIWLRRLICGHPNGYVQAAIRILTSGSWIAGAFFGPMSSAASNVIARINEIAALLNEAQAPRFRQIPTAQHLCLAESELLHRSHLFRDY